MKFILLVYTDNEQLNALPAGEFDVMMRDCLSHADELRRNGTLIDTQMLQEAPAAKSVRIRNAHISVTDGPFSETKEILGGFNLIEAADMDEAVRIAAEFPWTSVGCVEIRPVLEVEDMRQRVNASNVEGAA